MSAVIESQRQLEDVVDDLLASVHGVPKKRGDCRRSTTPRTSPNRQFSVRQFTVRSGSFAVTVSTAIPEGMTTLSACHFAGGQFPMNLRSRCRLRLCSDCALLSARLCSCAGLAHAGGDQRLPDHSGLCGDGCVSGARRSSCAGCGEDRELRQDRRRTRPEDRDCLEGWRLRSGGDSCLGRAILLVQNAIHAGEMDGKDSCLALLRDIVITKTRAALLDHVVLRVHPGLQHRWARAAVGLQPHQPEWAGA